MLISNGVLLLFSSGSSDLVWSRWQRRFILKMADSSGFSWWRHINTLAASNQATMSKDYFKTGRNGTKDTKPAQPVTENEFIAIISLAEAPPPPTQFHFFGLGGWPKIMTTELFLLKTSLSVCACVYVCVSDLPSLASFTHTEGPLRKQALHRSEVTGMMYFCWPQSCAAIRGPVEKDTMESIYHCLC